jgi:hypothetical protein
MSKNLSSAPRAARGADRLAPIAIARERELTTGKRWTDR